MTKKLIKPFSSIDVRRGVGYQVLIHLPAYLFIDMVGLPFGTLTSVRITGMTHEPITLESEGDEGVTNLQTRLNQLYHVSSLGRMYHDNFIASKVAEASAASTLAMTAVVEISTLMPDKEIRALYDEIEYLTPELADFKEKLGNILT